MPVKPANQVRKRFNAVEFMRRRRAEIDEEDKDLSWEEKTQKTLAILKDDPIWNWLKDRRVKAESHPRRRASGSKQKACA